MLGQSLALFSKQLRLDTDGDNLHVEWKILSSTLVEFSCSMHSL